MNGDWPTREALNERGEADLEAAEERDHQREALADKEQGRQATSWAKPLPGLTLAVSSATTKVSLGAQLQTRWQPSESLRRAGRQRPGAEGCREHRGKA